MEEKLQRSCLFNSFNIKNFKINNKEKRILKDLAKEMSEIADLTIQKQKISLWKKLNSLKNVRPLVCFSDLPWHEMDWDNELKLCTETPFARYLETRLRREIYQFKYMAVDMVVEPFLPCYKIVKEPFFGIGEDTDLAVTDDSSDIISKSFKPQFEKDSDIKKILMPKIIYEDKKTREMYQTMEDIFSGILGVKLIGNPSPEYPLWDILIRWYGVQKALTDLVLKPDYVHKIVDRFTNANLNLLDYYEENNLLALNNGNFRIGSGGLGYTDELPGEDYNPDQIKADNLWGFATSQIFSDVSPAMHYEFAVKYEIKWLSRFGLNYYGCCEPLHKKMDMIKKIPNLRKVSMSPWIDLAKAAQSIGDDYVFSWKPNPSIFASDIWEPVLLKKKLKEDLSKIKGCHIEIVMKDISTIRYKPQRLWEWAEIALEVVRET